VICDGQDMGTCLKHIYEKKVDTFFWRTKEIVTACVTAAVAVAAAAAAALPTLRW
jgi:hypothetical protein